MAIHSDTAVPIHRLSLMTFDMNIDLALGKLTVDDIFEITHRNGLQYLDPMNLSLKAVTKYTAAMNRYPVKVFCYISTCSMLRSKDKIRSRIEESLQIAEKLGANLLMLPPVDAAADRSRAERLGRDGVMDRMISGFELAVSMAAGTEIRPCLEITPQDFSCCSGIEDCEAILKQVPGLGLIFDTANMMAHGDNTMDGYDRLKPYISYVHLKDVELRKRQPLDRLLGGECLPDGRHMKGVLPGEGIVPFGELLPRMQTDGYEGMFALEYRRPGGLLTGMGAHADHVREALRYLAEKEGM